MGRSSSLKCYVVYCIRHKLSKKCYVGRTSGRGSARLIARRRFGQHIGAAAGANGVALQDILLTDGHAAFTLRVLGSYRTAREAVAAEAAAIRRHKSLVSERGYNMVRGAKTQ